MSLALGGDGRVEGCRLKFHHIHDIFTRATYCKVLMFGFKIDNKVLSRLQYGCVIDMPGKRPRLRPG